MLMGGSVVLDNYVFHIYIILCTIIFETRPYLNTIKKMRLYLTPGPENTKYCKKLATHTVVLFWITSFSVLIISQITVKRLKSTRNEAALKSAISKGADAAAAAPEAGHCGGMMTAAAKAAAAEAAMLGDGYEVLEKAARLAASKVVCDPPENIYPVVARQLLIHGAKYNEILQIMTIDPRTGKQFASNVVNEITNSINHELVVYAQNIAAGVNPSNNRVAVAGDTVNDHGGPNEQANLAAAAVTGNTVVDTKNYADIKWENQEKHINDKFCSRRWQTMGQEFKTRQYRRNQRDWLARGGEIIQNLVHSFMIALVYLLWVWVQLM